MKQQNMSLRHDSGTRKPAGGFCFIPAKDLIAAWMAYRRGLIELVDLRLWLACFELQARRCKLKKDQQPAYHHEEVHRLIGGVGGEHIRSSIRRLTTAGLLTWHESAVSTAVDMHEFEADFRINLEAKLVLVANHDRKVPVPRRMIRRLAQTPRRVEVATALAHLLRCLYYRKGRCHAQGSCKASWIAEVFEVDERNVKAARQQWVRDGWLIPKPSSQRSLNHRGPLFEINLNWSPNQPQSETDFHASQSAAGSSPKPSTQPVSLRGITTSRNSPETSLKPRVATAVVAERRDRGSPPPARLSTTQSPPPRENKELSSRIFKDQKPADRGPTGGLKTSSNLRSQSGGHLTGFWKDSGKEYNPDIRHVVPEDLHDPARLDTLFAQAVTAGLVQNSQCDRLRFFAAAEHARAVAERNPCGLFATVIRKQLWHFITQKDEDTARTRLLHLNQQLSWSLSFNGFKPAMTDRNNCRLQSSVNLGHAAITAARSAESPRSMTSTTPRQPVSISEVLNGMEFTPDR